MIADAVPWRDELVKAAARIEKRAAQRQWTERTGYLVERDVMVSAYAIRKLLDARRISNQASRLRVPVQRFALVGRVPDAWHYEFWESYDLRSPEPATLELRTFCNQLVHSFVFSYDGPEDGSAVTGFFFTSDDDRYKHLYLIAVADLTSLLRRIGRELIVSVSMRVNKKGERVITRVESAAVLPGLEDD